MSSPGLLVTVSFADDTAVLATDSDPGIASQELQTDLDEIRKWLKRWRIKANESKSAQVIFATRRETYPPVHTNNVSFFTKKMSSISGCTSTGDLPGARIY
jgi:hypothetical protein